MDEKRRRGSPPVPFAEQQRRDLIFEQYHTGKISFEEAKEKLKLSREYVYRLYKKSVYHGIDKKENYRKRIRKIRNDKLKKALEMARAGMPLANIAREAGVDKRSLRYASKHFFEGYEQKESLAGIRRKAIHTMKRNAKADILKEGRVTSKIRAKYPRLSLQNLYNLKWEAKKEAGKVEKIES